MADIDLARLRELAEAATHCEPWEADVDLGAVATVNELEMVCRGNRYGANPEDVAFIAAAHPATVLALVTLIEEAQGLINHCLWACFEPPDDGAMCDDCANSFRAWLAATEKETDGME